jgi:hypothetical protein
MLKGKYVLLSLAAALVCWQAAGIDTVNSGIVDPCKSTVSGAAGIGLVCPLGDGDMLSSFGSTITLTVRDNTNTGIPGIPATDMWLVGCNDGLLLCGGSQGSQADLATNASGVTTFTQEPTAGGCDTGLYAVVQGVVIQQAGSCQPLCLAIQMRSPDYKSSGAPGPPACGGDLKCPDSRVTSADFGWFVTHYTYTGHPGSYIACADYATPFETGGAGSILRSGDFSKFVFHYSGAGHKCPI